MKKFFALFAAVLFVGSMFAADAELVKGSNANDAKVNGKTAVKVGSKNNAGTMIIKVGSNAKSLKFNAVAWKGESNTKITLSAPKGITLSQTEFALNPNDNIQGGSPYEFTIAKEDDYVLPEITITGAETGAEITVATSSSTNRFVVWNATYEVGEAPKVYAPTFEPERPSFIGVVTIKLACATEGAKIYYTLDGTTPSATSFAYDEPFSVTKTVTVQAIAIKGEDKSAVASKTFTKRAELTVAEAVAAVAEEPRIEDQYVKGIICQIDKWSEEEGYMTYWISDDGKKDGDMVEIYHGFGLDGDEFVTANALQLGDKVTVYGTLAEFTQKEKKITEFEAGSIIVKLEAAPTAIDNTATEAKAVKFFENGQLVILKNGVKYNAQGAVIE